MKNVLSSINKVLNEKTKTKHPPILIRKTNCLFSLMIFTFVKKKKLKIKIFAIFRLNKAQFSSSRCFCWGCEGDEPHWCQAHLILFMLLTRFASMAWSPALESVVLSLFLRPSDYCTVIKCTFTFNIYWMFLVAFTILWQSSNTKHKFLN